MANNSEREKEIFGEALELGSLEEQRAFVKGACGGDEALQQAVEALLESYSRAGGFIPTRLTAPPGAPPGSTSSEGPGTLIGRYKLLQKIGEGGMGVVYMAEQEEPVRRRVALKIIKLGMDTKLVVARFEAERQALALMDHPNIARVLDGGATETGRPYFVMELVQGVPITEFCDKNHLSTEQRLKLFIPVCQAIQSAHQKGIIHRDLKPTNILVTLNPDGSGFPKVIDFGVAKATSQKLTEKTLFTAYGMIVGTPAYMSPEQAEMSHLDVDTRADVYSLGALLYELLTGSAPFPEQRLRSAGYKEMQRIILEEQPAKPSTRLSTLRGEHRSIIARNRGASELTLGRAFPSDLDWIVMKCLEKDRARRYETVNGLARDIDRHLRNEPITARPPSRLYEFQKTVRRHWVGFAAVGTILVILLLGVMVSMFEAVRARESEQHERKVVYASRMRLAQAAWEQNRVAQVRQLLKETADYTDRGFEWYYWQRQTHLELKTLRGHLERVETVAFSPDGRRILTGSRDTTAAKVWDTVSGDELFTLNGHLHGINISDWSPDGQRIATGSHDATVKLWDASGGKLLLTFTNHTGRIESVRFSSDSQMVLSSSDDGTAKLWEAATGRELLTLRARGGRMLDAAISPDGRRIVTAGDEHTGRVWDVASREELFPLRGHRGPIECVVFSPDGRRIATASRDRTAKVWDPATGKELLTLAGHTDFLGYLTFSPDSRRIATISGDQTKVWDASTGEDLFTLKGHEDRLEEVAFSPDGRLIATGSDDHTVKLWDANGNGEALTLKERHQVLAAAFSPDDQRIVTGNAAFTATVWEAATGKELLRLEGQHSSPVRSVAFSPDGERIVTGSHDTTVKIWDATSGKVLFALEGHSGPVTRVAYSPDGRLIATASSDMTARLWDAANGKFLREIKGHTGGVIGLAFSPDGRRIATASGDKTARIWDVAGCNELLVIRGHDAAVFSVAFSPDGRRLATASSDRTARIWDSASGINLVTLRGHTGGLRSIQFSPDGRRLLTAGEDATAKLWDAVSGEELLTFKGSGEGDYLSCAAFSHDGRRIVTDGGDWTARVWDAATVEQMASWQADEKQAAERLAVLAREQAAVEQRARAASIHDPGAIKEWLILGSISFVGFSGAGGLTNEQVEGEAHLRPRADELTPVYSPLNNDPRVSMHLGPSPGEPTVVGTNLLIWRASRLQDYLINFREQFGANAPYSVAYALCYITSETRQTGLLMKVGSEDQSVIYLNGSEIYRWPRPRKYVPDQDVVSGVELKAGVNVLLFKIANEEDFWRASLRFTDAAGQPVKGLRVTLTPPP
jgi:WD40 repeat protein/serine/threonine protein kinase